MNPYEILEKQLSGDRTSGEKLAFQEWLQTLSEKEYRQLLLAYEEIMVRRAVNRPEDPAWIQAIHKRIAEAETKAPVYPLKTGWVWRRAAVAVVVIALGTGAYWQFFKPINDLAKVRTPADRNQNDVAPGATKAILTLANGTKITLDSAKTGELAVQGKTTVTNNNGAITYTGKTTPDLLYNTLSTNRGEQSPPLTLSDGTKVWLNAASSIRFPVAFVGHAREVEITGEVYFEIFKNASKPFKVNINGKEEVEVLGTHFNVNAYKDETAIKTTLLEGSIKVQSVIGVNPSHQGVVLKPGQQAQQVVVGGKEAQSIKIVKDVSVVGVMAWKNGLFEFNNADLPTVMRQLSRWYNVEVVYENGTSGGDEFYGEIQRDLKLSQVLKILEKAQVHFRIEGRKLIVLP